MILELDRDALRELAVAARMYQELFPDVSAGYAAAAAEIVSTYAELENLTLEATVPKGRRTRRHRGGTQ